MGLLSNLFGAGMTAREIAHINRRRAELADSTADALRDAFHATRDLQESVAIVAVIAARALGLEMFDVQLRGALALARGRIAEMQTGEGKTLACTPAVAWYAREGGGVHVMTVNDYLARRDAQWMGGIYQLLGLSVGCIQQIDAARKTAAAPTPAISPTPPPTKSVSTICATDLRCGSKIRFTARSMPPSSTRPIPFSSTKPAYRSCWPAAKKTKRPSRAAPIRWCGASAAGWISRLTNSAATSLSPTPAPTWRNSIFTCGNIYAEQNLAIYTAVHNAIHAHALLRRDVDYVVKNAAIESVDQFKGRIAQDRRWPAGLHTAHRSQRGHLPFRKQGRVLASITLQNLVALYPKICGMTGTAATQAEEFRQVLQHGCRGHPAPTGP